MAADHADLGQALGSRGADVILGQVLEHRGARVAHEGRRLEQAEHHDGHDRLLDLGAERRQVVYLQGRVVDEWQQPEFHAEDDDHQEAREEGRH